MYQSPINISYIQDKINVAFEDGVFKAVRRVGIDVNKEELLKALAYDRGQYEQGYRDALKEQPEQKHGHWIRSPGFKPDWKCSVCNGTYFGNARMFKFCPDCGARMDEEVGEDV